MLNLRPFEILDQLQQQKVYTCTLLSKVTKDKIKKIVDASMFNYF